MIKTILTIAVAIALGITAQAAHIGDSVQQTVGVSARVPLISSQPTAITEIVLDSGVWSVSGQVNILSLSQPAGILFTAGNISVNSPSFLPDGTSSIQAEGIGFQGNVIRPVSLTSRIVDVPDGTHVFLVGGTFGGNPLVTAWGFIAAVKIRNHVGD